MLPDEIWKKVHPTLIHQAIPLIEPRSTHSLRTNRIITRTICRQDVHRRPALGSGWSPVAYMLRAWVSGDTPSLPGLEDPQR